MRTFILILALSSIVMTRVFTHKISDEGVMMKATIQYVPMIFETASFYENPFAGGSAEGKCKDDEKVQTFKGTNDKEMAVCYPHSATIKDDASCPPAPTGVTAKPKAMPADDDKMQSCALTCTQNSDCSKDAICIKPKHDKPAPPADDPKKKSLMEGADPKKDDDEMPSICAF